MTEMDAAGRLRAWRAHARKNEPSYDHMRDVSYESVPVCDADLDAVLDELERLRAEQLDDARAVVAAIERRHVSGKGLIRRTRQINALFERFSARIADAVPQQPERGADGAR